MGTFGERLRRVREQRGWSQHELARRVGVSFMTIYRLETGRHQEPRLRLAVALARTLNISLDWLTGVYEDKSEGMAAVGLLALTLLAPRQ